MPRDQVHGGDTLYLSALNYIKLKTEKYTWNVSLVDLLAQFGRMGDLAQSPPDLL